MHTEYATTIIAICQLWETWNSSISKRCAVFDTSLSFFAPIVRVHFYLKDWTCFLKWFLREITRYGTQNSQKVSQIQTKNNQSSLEDIFLKKSAHCRCPEPAQDRFSALSTGLNLLPNISSKEFFFIKNRNSYPESNSQSFTKDGIKST